MGVDPHGVSPDLQFDWTERSIVPRAGAVIREAGEPLQCHVALPPRSDAPGIVDTPCTE